MGKRNKSLFARSNIDAPEEFTSVSKTNGKDSGKNIRQMFSLQEREENTLMRSLDKPNVDKNTQFLSQPNINAFNTAILEKTWGKYSNTTITTREECLREVTGYFELCSKYNIVPIITGLSLYLQYDVSCLYTNARNPNCPFADILCKAINTCHYYLEHNGIAGTIPAQIFTLMESNYYGVNQTSTIKLEPNVDNTNNYNTLQTIKEQIKKEKENKNVIILSTDDDK